MVTPLDDTGTLAVTPTYGLTPSPSSPAAEHIKAIKAAWDKEMALNAAEGQALIQFIAASGQAEQQYLLDKGKLLLTSLATQGTNALNAFVSETAYNLDMNRGLTPGEKGYRPGYGGVRHFAPTPDPEQVKTMPQYASIAAQNAEKMATAKASNDLAMQKAGTDLASQMAKAQQDIAARQARLAFQYEQALAEAQQPQHQTGFDQGGGGGASGADAYITDDTKTTWKGGSTAGAGTMGSGWNPFMLGGGTMGSGGSGTLPGAMAHGGATGPGPNDALTAARQRARAAHARRTQRR